MHTEIRNEIRDLHAARFAEIAALREMLVIAGEKNQGPLEGDVAGRMRSAVREILRLQKIMSRIDG